MISELISPNITLTLSNCFGSNFLGVMQLSGCNDNFLGGQIQNMAISNYTLAITLTPFNCFRISHTVCGCRALMVGKQGFAQGKILRVCGEFFQGVHGSCYPN